MSEPPLPTHSADAPDVRALRQRIADLERQCAELHRAEHLLLRNQELHRSTVQSMLGGLVRVNMDGAVVDANLQAQRILGLTFDQLTQKFVSDFRSVTIREDGSPFPVEEYPVSRCLVSGQPQTPAIIGLASGPAPPQGQGPAQRQGRGQDQAHGLEQGQGGGVIWCIFTAAPLFDPQTRQQIGAVVTFLDVTEQRRAAAALRQQTAILDQIHDAVIETDLNGNITRWNRGAERLYGYTAQEALGQHVEMLHPDQSRHMLQSHVIEPLKKRGEHELELQIKRKDGRLRIVHLSLSLLRNEAGHTTGMIGFSVDITESREAQEALAANAARMRAILDHSPALIYMKDRDRRYTEFNRTGQQLFNTTRQAMIGKTARDLFQGSTADEIDHDDDEVLRKGQIITRERLIPSPAGHRVFLDMKFPLLDERGRTYAICGIATDITDRKRTEELMRQNTDLQRMMLSELDHRVRNNLASLAALIDLSARDKTSVQDLASAIRGRVQAMSSVHSLLSRSRWSAVNLQQLMESLLPDDLRDRATIDGPQALLSPRQATAMGMVLQELVANSLKYGSLREINGRVWLRWTLQPAEGQPERIMTLVWEERGGPPITTAPRNGLGSDLIIGFARTELRGEARLAFPAEGARHQFKFRLDPIEPNFLDTIPAAVR